MASLLTLPELTAKLLAHLRQELESPRLSYAEAPAVIRDRPSLVCSLSLTNGPPSASGPLIVRVFPRSRGRYISRLRAIHDTLREAGFPAPAVVLASDGGGPVDRPFLLLERVPGRTALDTPARLSEILRLPDIIANVQERLHGLDSQGFAASMVRRGISRRHLSVERALKRVTRWTEKKSLDYLIPGVRWLQDHLPPQNGPLVVCHGDLHGTNLLLDGSRVSAVIDWESALIADPMFDVANSMWTLVPSRRAWPAPPPVRMVVRRLVRARYLRAYGRVRPVRQDDVKAYCALRVMLRLVRTTNARELADSFHGLTGVRLQLPA